NGGAWPPPMQGYSIPETTRAYGAVLLNADREEFTDSLGPRDEVSQAIVDEVAAGRGVETADGRPAVYLDTTRIAEDDANVSLPYMLRRNRRSGRTRLLPFLPPPVPAGRHRPARGADPDLSSPPLPERRARHRRAVRADCRGAFRVGGGARGQGPGGRG